MADQQVNKKQPEILPIKLANVATFRVFDGRVPSYSAR